MLEEENDVERQKIARRTFWQIESSDRIDIEIDRKRQLPRQDICHHGALNGSPKHKRVVSHSEGWVMDDQTPKRRSRRLPFRRVC